MPDTITDVFAFYCEHAALLGPFLQGDREALQLTWEQEHALEKVVPHIEATLVEVLSRCWAAFRTYDKQHRRHVQRAKDQTRRSVILTTRSAWGPIIVEGNVTVANAGFSFSEVEGQWHLTTWVWVHPTRLTVAEQAVRWAKAEGGYIWSDRGVPLPGQRIQDLANHATPVLVQLVAFVERALAEPIVTPVDAPT